jgi:predicted DNA-binding transcriptional regulator YafY
VLCVLQLIQGRGRWSAREIARELECEERTMHRDLQALEMAGVPWFFNKSTGSY